MEFQKAEVEIAKRIMDRPTNSAWRYWLQFFLGAASFAAALVLAKLLS